METEGQGGDLLDEVNLDLMKKCQKWFVGPMQPNNYVVSVTLPKSLNL